MYVTAIMYNYISRNVVYTTTGMAAYQKPQQQQLPGSYVAFSVQSLLSVFVVVARSCTAIQTYYTKCMAYHGRYFFAEERRNALLNKKKQMKFK